MALTAVQQRGARGRTTISESGGMEPTAEVPYLIKGVGALDVDISTLYAATGLPAIGSTNHGASCLGYRAEQRAEAKSTNTVQWLVWVQYGKWPLKTNPKDHDPDDATARPAQITRRVIERLEPIDQDALGNPIVNVVGDPFDPQLEEPKYRLAITIERYVSVANAIGNNIHVYCGKTNANNVGQFQPGELLCRSIEETATYEGIGADLKPQKVIHQVISLEVDEDLWVREVLNRGPQYRKEAGGPILAVEDEYGVKTGEIVLLDQQGLKLPAGAPPHFIPFASKKREQFQDLNLPSLI